MGERNKKTASTEPKKEAGVRIRPDLRQRAKVLAAKSGVQLQAVLNEIVEEGLKKRGA